MMWKHWVIFSLGIAVIVLPFLGFPQSVDTVLFFLIGASISLFSYLVVRQTYTLIQNVKDFIKEERKTVRLRKEKPVAPPKPETDEENSREA